MSKPVCSHPELRPTMWDQPKPPPTEMVGCCSKNMTCSVCGYGWASIPCNCPSSNKPVNSLTAYITWQDGRGNYTFRGATSEIEGNAHA